MTRAQAAQALRDAEAQRVAECAAAQRDYATAIGAADIRYRWAVEKVRDALAAAEDTAPVPATEAP